MYNDEATKFDTINIDCMLKQLQTNENNQPLMKCIYTLGNPCNWQLEKQQASFPAVVSLRTNSVQCIQVPYINRITDVQLLLAATTCQFTQML